MTRTLTNPAALRAPMWRSRIAVSTGWTVLAFGGSQAIRIASKLVLVALLAPEAFGLMALVTTVFVGLQQFSDIGLGPCIVQSPRGNESVFLRTAYTIQALRGAALFVLGAALAWPMAAFYGQPALMVLLPVTVVSCLITGFNSMGVWSLTREIRQGKIARLRLTADFCGQAVAIGWALWQPTVWALVIGLLVQAVVFMAGSHWISERRTGFGWERSAARTLIGFGSAIMLSTLTWFLAAHGERLILGKLITITELGVVWVMAMLANLPSTAITQVGTRVILPTLSSARRQGDDRLALQYRRFRLITAASAVGAAVVMIGVAPWLAGRYLPEAYAAAAWMLPIFGLRTVVQINQSAGLQWLVSGALLRWGPAANSARLAVILIGLPFAVAWGGLEAGVWVLGLSALPAYVVIASGVCRHRPAAVKLEVVGMGATAIAVALVWWIGGLW
ncbi:MAG: oligosaccharide flippase family protein [Planctomycetota bacterium]